MHYGLWVACVCLGIVDAAVLGFPTKDVRRLNAPESAGRDVSAQVNSDNDEKESFEMYEVAFLKYSTSILPLRPAETRSEQENTEMRVHLDAEYQVIGIVVDAQSVAVLQNRATKEIFFLSEGDALDGFILEKILLGKVVVQGQSRTVELLF